jgi:DnaJ homolog subfamily C member 9
MKRRTASGGRFQGNKCDKDMNEEEWDTKNEEDIDENQKSPPPSSSLQQQISFHFGSNKSLYEILNLPSSAVTATEIHRAYRQSALKYHPDKGGDPEKFKILSAIHAFLSDEEKRRVYDSTGTIDDEDSTVGSDDFDFWYDYYRRLFPQISVDDINNFEKQYKGSEEEQQDVWDAYRKYSGELKHMMDSIMFAEVGDEERIIAIIEDGIAQNVIESTPKYVRSKKNSMKSQKKVAKSNTDSASQKKEDDSEASLRNAILSRQQSKKSNPFESIMAKYADSSTDLNDYEVDESAFMKTQEKLTKKNSRNSRAKGGEVKDVTGKKRKN